MYSVKWNRNVEINKFCYGAVGGNPFCDPYCILPVTSQHAILIGWRTSQELYMYMHVMFLKTNPKDP